MTSATPWSVKGIDPKAREVAKDLARRSGMTLGDWLNRMILEDEDPEEIGSQSYFTQAASEPVGHRWVAPPQATDFLNVPAPPPEPVASRIEAPIHPGDEIGKVALALDRLAERIERSEGHAGLAISGVEASVRQALARIETAERETISVAARFEGVVDEAVTEQSRLAERLRRVEREAAGPRSAEALKSLEQALGKVAHHLYDGEVRTQQTLVEVQQRLGQVEAFGGGDSSGLIDAVVSRLGERIAEAEGKTAQAMESLQTAFSSLDGRLGNLESGSSPAIDRRLEQLAVNLTHRVEASRDEIARKLQSSSEGRFDRMERKLLEMTDHVRLADQTSAKAIERMGREVLTMADTLNRRVQVTETRSADAIEQVGGEVARIALAVESKLGRTDNVHADALEKLGAEIGRISERLTERIANAERRSALAIDDVGEQVARVTERMNQRSERSSDDLVERIRQSEERTARMLEDAREKIDRKLAETDRRLVGEPVEPVAVKPVADREPLSPFGDDPFPSFGPVEPANPESDPILSADPEPMAAANPFPAEPEQPSFDVEDFEAADGFAAISEPADQTAEPDFAQTAFGVGISPAEVADPGRPLSTREVIEQARAAARAAAQTDASGKKSRIKPPKPAKAEKVKKAAGTSLFAGFGAKPKVRAGSSLQTGVLVSGVAACLCLSMAGYVLLSGKGSGPPPKRVAEAIAVLGQGKSKEIMTSEADTTPFGGAPRAAIAITTRPIQPASIEADMSERYAAAAQAIEDKQPGGLAALQKVAGQGYPAAQFYLAKLYENGTGGVKKDLSEARRWTERAAEGGDPKAMHNLGIAYIAGTGGPKNSTVAAQWFRRAADLGLLDSQYNLAALYEQGLGVSQNGAEAYKWYLIASSKGDGEARNSAQRVKADLSADARAVAERAAASFKAIAPNPVLTARASPDASGLQMTSTAQRALSRLGYYQGPTDGSPSPALKLAVAAYQRDQGAPATGQLDAGTVARLSVFTR